MPTTPPTCEFCEKPSTVFRAYEGEQPDTFMCDDCCKAKCLEKKVWPVKDHPNNPDNGCPADYHHDPRY